MTRLVLDEVARWVRAVGAPLAVVAIVVVTPHLLPEAAGTVLRLVPDSALSVAWLAAGAAALAWLLTACVRAAIQPAHDRRAFEHLQDMRDRAGLPDHTLLCILRVVWISPAGEHATAVDVRTGATLDLWLAESDLAPGSYALVRLVGGIWLVLDIAAPRIVTAARRRDRLAACRGDRRERRAAADVIGEAEALIRGA